MLRAVLRKPVTWVLLGVLVVGAAFGLYWFQPWRLLTSKTVDDAAPIVAETGGSMDIAPSRTVGATPRPAQAALIAQGEFVTHEHDTSGRAQLVRLPDGRHQLILQNLSTSDGPDLRVWLTDQPVREGVQGWKLFDDGRWVELGRLKGTHGTQVYTLPDDADPADFASVSIWCKRFAVSFGAAPLEAA